MIFLELVLQNFGPYVGKQILDLRPGDAEEPRPILLLGGMNGGGKTTLMDAIRLVLYGQRALCSTRGNLGYSDFLMQCVNRQRKPGESTRVELAFEVVEDGQPTILRVVRYWEHDGKETLGVLRGEEWPDRALASTWDEYIEDLLPLGISNLFLFDGEQVKELAEQEIPPPLVVGAIQSLLGLELSQRLAQDLDVLASRKRRELANAKQRFTFDELEAKLTQQKGELEAVNQQLAHQQNEVERAEKKFQEAMDKFVSEGGKIAHERQSLEAQSQTFIQQAQHVRQSLCELATTSLPLALISPLLADAKTQGETETRQQQQKIAGQVIEERDRRLLNYLQELSLSPESFAQIANFLQGDFQALNAQVSEGAEPWLKADENALKQLDLLLSYEINQCQIKAREKQEQLKSLEQEIDVLDRQIAAAASPEIYEQLQKAVQQSQKEVVQLKATQENLKRRQEEIKRTIDQTKKQIEEFAEEELKSRNNQHILNSIAKAQTTLQQFREKLTLKKLNKLEVEVTECFRYLLRKTDLVHRIAIDTQTFALSLFDPQGQAVPKHRLSAGEKQLLAIALLWGLARVSGRRLPVAIDTPLGRLDSSHRQNLVERYFPAASHQVMLLSTDTEIGQKEAEQLRQQNAIAREYLLEYSQSDRQTTIKPGYFW